MKTLILKIGIIIVLLVIFSSMFFNPLFSKLEKGSFNKTINQFYDSNKDSIDILIFGSSHAMNSYNPKIIDKTLNTYTFNFGSAAQKLITTKFLLQNIIDETNPKVVIIDLFYFSVSEITNSDTKNYQLNVYSSIKNSFSKANHTFLNFGIQGSLETLSPTIRNHENWNRLEFGSNIKGNEWKKLIRGFLPLNGNMKEKDKNKFKGVFSKKNSSIEPTSSIDFLSTSQRDLIIEIDQLLKSRKIKLLLVSAPYLNRFYSEKNNSFHSSIKYISDSLEINYLDFNNHYDELDLEFDSFREPSHVNVIGANKLSSFLSKYISEKTKFKIKDSSYLKKYLERTRADSNESITAGLNKNPTNKKTIFKENEVHLKKEHMFIENMEISEIILFQDELNKHIAFRYDNTITKDFFENIDFGIHGIFWKEDYYIRPKWMLETDDDRITWKSTPKDISVDGKNYLLLSFKKKSKIESFKKLRVFLKNKTKFNGVIGEPLEIDEASFKKNKR